VIGSNIANIGLILAVAALISPPRIDPSLRGRELWMLLASTAVVPLILVDGAVDWYDGVGLLGAALAYTVWMVMAARPSRSAAVERRDLDVVADAAEDAGLAAAPRGRLRQAGLAVLGLALLIAGGHLLVEGAVGLARDFGMSERLIGLTIVAVGTSLPELATSVIAALRGHSDIAVGNVIGSNIFNVLLILGASSLAGPVAATPSAIALDLIVLGAMTVVAALVIRTRDRVSRVEATFLLVGYVAFLSALALTAGA